MEKKLPGFLFSPVSAVLVKSGEMMETMIKFKTTNFAEVEGFIQENYDNIVPIFEKMRYRCIVLFCQNFRWDHKRYLMSAIAGNCFCTE